MAVLGSANPPRLPESDGSGGYWWVDPVNGSDSNNGSAGAPWRTVYKAITSVNADGAVITVRDGDIEIPLAQGGAGAPGAFHIVGRRRSPTNPVTIQAENRHGVRVYRDDYPPDSAGYVWAAYVQGSTGYRIRGFKFSPVLASRAYGTWVDGGSHWIEFDGCLFEDMGSCPMAVRGHVYDGGWATNIWWINCIVRPSGTVGVNYDGLGDRYDYGANCSVMPDSWQPDYFRTKGSHMSYTGMGTATGADSGQQTGAVRTVHANCLFIGQTPGRSICPHPHSMDSYFVNNTFFGNDRSYFWSHSFETVGNPTYPNGIWSGYGAGAGIEIGREGRRDGNVYWSHGNVCANNVFSNMAGHAISFWGSPVAPAKLNKAIRNWAYACENGRGSQGRTGVTFEQDIANNYALACEHIDNTVSSTAPGFVNPHRSRQGDFHLLPSSPCIGQAMPEYAPPFDLDGRPRSATAPSLGAYEYADVTPPPPPPPGHEALHQQAYVTLQTAALYKTWAKANPGEAAKLDGYWRNGGTPPLLKTAFGRAMVQEVAAYLGAAG